jgi:REP element-mobilizing transposase RayT
MVLNELGKIVDNEWLRTMELRENVELDYYVIMPNHIHGIIIIEKVVETIGSIVSYCEIKMKRCTASSLR